MSVGDGGRRRTQAWMGSGVPANEPGGAAVPAQPTPPPKAARWVPNPSALPSYPTIPAAAPASPETIGPRVPGQIIGGRYRLDRRLGRGTHTEAWAGEHVELGRPVAIKFVLTNDAGLVDRMLHEARTIARIHHPHLAEPSDFGRADGQAYFVTELITGTSLLQLLEQHGPIAWARAVTIVQQVAEALAAGHTQGVVHRDLRPANVFLLDNQARPGWSGQPGDFVKLIDFGLGCSVEPTQINPAAVGFVSPEQASGAPLDPRSDVYGLGCLLFALITGEPPFIGPVEQVLWQQIHQQPRSLRERAPRQFIPEELERIVARCIAKQPEARYADMRELGIELAALARFAAAKSQGNARILPHESTSAASRSQVMGFAGQPAPRDAQELEQRIKPITASVPALPPSKSSPVKMVVVVVGVALLVSGVGFGAYMGVRSLIDRVPAADEAVEATEVDARPAPSAPEPSVAPAPAPTTPTQAPAATLAESKPAAGTTSDATAPASGDATGPSGASSKGSTTANKIKPAPVEPAKHDEQPPPTDVEPAPAPEPKPTSEPESKAKDKIGHDDLVDPWG